jgi:precorrin-2 dehydrogenase/sirohydrochlorin ferrochelatase
MAAPEVLMLPIALDPTRLRIGLTGLDPALSRRRATLIPGGVEPIEIAPEGVLDGLDLLFVAGLPRGTAAALAARARAAGILVNVEDEPDLCDFHMPATVRRGDLALTVSTSGRAPGLARLVREWLGRAFGAEWAERVDAVGQARARWRGEGASGEEVYRRIRDLARRERWLP